MTVTLASCQHCGPISIYGSQGLWSHGQSVSPLPLDLSLLTSPASCLAMCYSLTHTSSHSSLCLWIWHSPVTDEPHPTFSTWPLSCLRKSHASVVTLNPQEIHQHPSASSPAPPLSCFYIVNYVLHSEKCVNVCLQPGDAHKSHLLEREVGQCCSGESSWVPWTRPPDLLPQVTLRSCSPVTV